MPEITINTPFNYQAGGTVVPYPKGKQQVPQAVAEHAWARGFAEKPKATAAAKASAEKDSAAKA